MIHRLLQYHVRVNTDQQNSLGEKNKQAKKTCIEYSNADLAGTTLNLEVYN